MNTIPASATITLYNGTYRSAHAPTSWCDLRVGRTWRVSIESAGYERRTLALHVGSDGRARFSGRRLGYVGRAIFVPGWGLSAQGYVGEAFMAFVNTAFTGLETYQAWNAWEDAKDRRDARGQAALDAFGTASQADALTRFHLEAHKSDLYRDRFYALSALSGWMYLGNVIETFYRALPPASTRQEDGTYLLRTPRKSGVRAVAQSALWPGSGQYYRGHIPRGFFFQTAFTTTALFTIDRWLLYRLRAADYDNALADFRNATTAADRDRLGATARRMWDGRESLRRQFLGWAGVSGGVWLLNVIDAAGSSSSDRMPGRFAVDTSVRGSTVYQGIRVKF